MKVNVAVSVGVLVASGVCVMVFVMTGGVKLMVGVGGVPVTVRVAVGVIVAVGFTSGASKRKINPMQ